MNAAVNLSAAPHARDKWTTPFIMMIVLIALLFAAEDWFGKDVEG